jgi:hypothetical protein
MMQKSFSLEPDPVLIGFLRHLSLMQRKSEIEFDSFLRVNQTSKKASRLAQLCGAKGRGAIEGHTWATLCLSMACGPGHAWFV